MATLVYRPAPTGALLHAASDYQTAFVRGMMGPIGSGKSVTMVMDLLIKANAQRPDRLYRRKSRWVIIRNTYRELVDTTLKTWYDWMPANYGEFTQKDMTYKIRRTLADETTLEADFLFRALDKPNDVKKLLSLDLTGGWVNEAREIPKAIVDMLQGRVGRYPAKRDGGPTWFGVIMDTNPPDSDHWWHKIFEEERPHNWKLFKQPSGLSEGAENIKNLPPGYYQNMMPGKSKEWINVYVHGKYGIVMDGQPVYPEYNDDVHYTDKDLHPVCDEPLHVGIDFGLTPAAGIAQFIRGQWRLIDEVVTKDTTMGAQRFGRRLKKHLRSEYPNYMVKITGDPAGEDRAQTDEQTPFQILDTVGLEATPAHTNDFTVRRDTAALVMGRMTFTGQPGFLIGPKCQTLRKAYMGGYQFRRLLVPGEERYQNVPNKNKYSHVAEGVQYLLLGAGEDDALLGHDSDNWDLDYSDLNRAAV